MRDLRVNVGNIGLQVREYEGTGEAIIFLHYGGGNLMMWQRTVPYFQEHYRLVLPDLREHGKSDKLQNGAHIDDMADDIIGVMEYLKLEQAHIIGSSLGAEVGLSLAANYPEKIASLVCEGALYSEFGPYGIWEGSEPDFKEFVAQQVEKARNRPTQFFPSVGALVEASKQTFEQFLEWNEYIEAVEAYDAYEISEGKFVNSWQNLAIAKYLEQYLEYRFEDYYRQVKCPVLIAPGEEELKNERIKAAVQGFSKLTPKGEVATVPGWVHPYGWMLEPEGMSQVVLKFLAKVCG